MTYVKTDWNDNASPAISATNLDKMEQGIEDAHNLVGLPKGLTGAVQPTRYVGATTLNQPTSGTFAVGDYVITNGGDVWICTTAGSPGTWRVAGNKIVCTSGTRPSTPYVGLCIYETDTGSELYYYGATTGWRRAWNLPWGHLGTVYTPANFTFNTSVGQSAVFTPALLDNRWYQAFVRCEVQNGAVTGVVDTITLYDSTGAAGVGTLRVVTPGAANFQIAEVSSIVFDSPATANRDYRIRAVSSASATNQTIANISVWFVDMGNSSTPPSP